MSIDDFQLYLSCLSIALLSLLGIWHAGTKLASNYSTDVQVFWYFLSLSSVCTLITATWATSMGAIDSHGTFQGPWGVTLGAFLRFMLDLETDIKIFGTILAIVVIPQAVSYVLSGLFGCAAAPLFLGKVVSFFVWSTVKSLVVAAGIFLSAAMFGWLRGWSTLGFKGVASLFCFAMMLLMLALYCLYLYRDIDAPTIAPATKLGLALHRRVVKLRSWLTRKSAQ